MAYKKEIKPWLKENGYTWDDMDRFWEELIQTNPKVSQLAKSGVTWDQMNMSVITSIPTQKQRDEEQKIKKEEEERLKAEAEQKAKEEEDYYWEHFEEIMIRKIDAGERLTEQEIRMIVFETNEIERNKGENRRWSRSVKSIVEMCSRYFCVDWEEGLTEYQENEFYNQPYEVKKNTYEKTITVTEWKKVS